MQSERWQSCTEIFNVAVEQPPNERAAFLERSCDGDEALRRKVELLLKYHDTLGDFIELPAFQVAPELLVGDPEALIGQKIGHYKISESIGTGGMGEVYLATDVVAGRKAALKLLPLCFTGDAERLKRFQQEAHAVVGLNHPNILTVYEIGEDHSIHYIASELIEGETLRQRLAHGPVQLSEAIDIAIQVASALAAAHNAGIVHRDIKPENIMLRPDGYVKVLDFGIAKLAEQEVPTAMPRDEALLLVETNLGAVLGTVRYMSPEQACGEHVDQGTDIWSLGVVLYEIVTGHAPFTGDIPKEVMSSILEKEPPPLTRYIARAPAELQQIISKTLRKDRTERYRNAQDLLKALKDLLRNLEFESFFMNGFFDEVKRRKVYRVAAAYIIVAAGIIQLASAAFPAWDLPNSALRLVIMLLLIGFPLALILGWVFDVTPQGIRATPRAALGTHRLGNVIMLVATGVIISAVAGFFLLPRVSAHKVEKSIAVLPLENLSEEKENAFFADGIQDELLSNLSKIKDLKVISRTSVMQYKSGITRNLKEIAQQLGVSNVVEGSVRRSGNHIRVSVQLIDAKTDRHLWVQSYDRTLTDSLALEGELATEIASAVGATLTPQEKALVAYKPTNNPAAYDAYLRGRALMGASARDRSTLESAIRSSQEAVKLDPNFVLAWAYLSYRQSDYYWIGFDRSPARLAAARDALDRALALNPNLPETHLALGYYRYYGERNFTGALAEFQRAEQGLPNNADVNRAIGVIQRRLGHWDEAIASLRRAVELDPRNVEVSDILAFTYIVVRRFPEALAIADRVLALEPTNTDALWTKADVFWSTGDLKAVEPLLANPGTDPHMRGMQALYERRYAAAIEIFSKVLADNPDDEWWKPLLFKLGLSHQRAGDVAAARATYQQAAQHFQLQLDKVARDSFLEADLHASLGQAYAGLGEAASAIAEGQKPWPCTLPPKIRSRAPTKRRGWRVSTRCLAMPILRFPFSSGCCRRRIRLLRHCCDSIRCGIRSATIRVFKN
jgi:TolB-like protein/Flp pilus assembly protein TadD